MTVGIHTKRFQGVLGGLKALFESAKLIVRDRKTVKYVFDMSSFLD